MESLDAGKDRELCAFGMVRMRSSALPVEHTCLWTNSAQGSPGLHRVPQSSPRLPRAPQPGLPAGRRDFWNRRNQGHMVCVPQFFYFLYFFPRVFGGLALEMQKTSRKIKKSQKTKICKLYGGSHEFNKREIFYFSYKQGKLKLLAIVVEFIATQHSLKILVFLLFLFFLNVFSHLHKSMKGCGGSSSPEPHPYTTWQVTRKL